MEDPQNTPEPFQQFENIDFNSSLEENNKADSINDDQDQVNYNLPYCLMCVFFFFSSSSSNIVFFIRINEWFND